eukprot:gene1451-12070_t
MSQLQEKDTEDEIYEEETESSRPLDAIWGKKLENEFLYNYIWSKDFQSKNDSDGKKFGKIQNDQKSHFEISFSNENGESHQETWKKPTSQTSSVKDSATKKKTNSSVKHARKEAKKDEKYATTQEGKQIVQFRTNYLNICEKLKILPSNELLRNMKTCIRNQQPLKRLSICHANIDDAHIKAIVSSFKYYDEIQEILLNHNNITDEGASELIHHILKNQSLTSLELFGNKVGDKSQKDFSILLRTNQFLKRLKIGDNLITSFGAEELSKGLSENTGLTQLHLGGNKIEMRGLQFISKALLKNTTLTSLGLRDNAVGASGMQALSELLLQPNCELSDIQLKGNFILPKGSYYLSQSISLNKSLKVLELQSNTIGQAGVKVLCESLKENKSIHALNFNDNELGDEGAEYISDLLKINGYITTLGLANNKIRKKGATKLASCLTDSLITGLDLGNNEIGNGGAVALAESLQNNSVLTSLDLRSCEIHLKGIIGLSEMANVNTTLRHLDLGNNYCKNQGAIEWAKVLAKNTTLTRLCLTDNQIYHDGGEALARSLQTNYTLRNFSFGGQGASANRIDSSVRRVIDSIIAENKKNWEISQSTDIPLQELIDNNSPNQSPRESPRSTFRINNLKSKTAFSSSSAMYGLPTWFTLHEGGNDIKDEKILESKLNYIFSNNLLKAENPKFPGCYFIGNIFNTLRKIYPDIKVDEIQLVHFAYNHPKYYVHLSREMVKTQIKFLSDEEYQKIQNGSTNGIEDKGGFDSTSPATDYSKNSYSPLPSDLTSPTKQFVISNQKEEEPLEIQSPFKNKYTISPISLLKNSPRETILEDDLIDDSEWDNILNKSNITKTSSYSNKPKRGIFGVIGEPN